MKKIAIYLILIFSCTAGISQNVFNRIVEDTIGHVMNSVIVVDTGYIFASGTGNEYGVRCFALTYVDELGEKQWKKVIGDIQNQFWEGWYGNFKKCISGSYISGSIVNPVDQKRGIHINTFDSVFNVEVQNIVMYDTIDKRVYYSILSNDNFFYMTGIIYCSDIEQNKMILVKSDGLGNYLWHKTFGINLYELGSYIIEASNGNILTGGDTWVTHSNNTRWYLLETDTAGNIIWERTFGRSNYNNGHVQGIIETADSNYLACGSYPVARYGGGGGEYLWDGCLRKIDTDGNLIWEKHYRDYHLSHTGDTYLHNSISDLIKIENSFYILGANYDCISWKNRAYLAKLNMRGEILWKKDYYAIDTNSFSQYLVSFKPTNDKGFILAGYGNEYDLFGYDPPQQAWLVKTDSLGIDGLCYTAPPELNIDIVLPATVNCNDTITIYAYIAGKSAPYTIETSVGQLIDSIYYPPTFVPIEIGLSHVNLEWDNSTYFEETITEATLSNHEWGQCIAKPVEFYTPHTSGSQQINITVTDAYGESKTITKEVFVNECGSGIAGEVVNSVNVYPNPAVENLYLDIAELVSSAYFGSAQHKPLSHQSLKCEIYNSLGQLVKTLQISNNLTVINVKDFASGMYQLKIVAGTGNVLVRSFEKQ